MTKRGSRGGGGRGGVGRAEVGAGARGPSQKLKMGGERSKIASAMDGSECQGHMARFNDTYFREDLAVHSGRRWAAQDNKACLIPWLSPSQVY